MVGCTTGQTDLTSAFKRPPALATRESEEPGRSEIKRTGATTPPKEQRSGLARLFRRAEPDVEQAGASETGRGRVFSSFIDRLTGRSKPKVDPFADQPVAAAKPRDEAAHAPAGVARAPANPADRSRAVASTRTVRPAQAQAPARTATPTAPKLTDEQLWKMFETDAERGAAAQPTSRAMAAAPPVEEGAPEWARDATTPRKTVTRPPRRSTTGPGSTLAASEPAPSAPGRARVQSAPAAQPAPPARTSQDEARLRVETLLVEARRQQRAGRLEEAYRTAAAAQKLAERERLVFAPRQEQPAETLRGIVADLQQTRREQQHNEPPVQRAIASTADARGGVHNALHEQELPEPAADRLATVERRTFSTGPEVAATAQRLESSVTSATRVDAVFPELHTWRSAQPNRPLNLADNAARRTGEASSAEPAAPGTKEAQESQGSLLARVEADRSRVLSGAEQSTTRSDEDAIPGDLLASAGSSLAVAPPPPLDIGAERLSGEVKRSRKSGSSSAFWWILAASTAAALGMARVLKGRWSADEE